MFFRGYVQRNLERGLGAVAGMVATGIVFGLFHLRFSQVVPLALIGIYMAYLAWRTGSVWIPILIHFVNNGAMVILAVVAGDDGGLATPGSGQIPWYLVLVGLGTFAACMYGLQRRSHAVIRQRSMQQTTVA